MSEIILGDCLEEMKKYPDNHFDLVLTDPPYGTTRNDWDVVVDFMSEALRIASAVVTTSSQPYTSKLINKYLKYYRHCWVWEKDKAANILNSKREPLKVHEDIIVFGKPKYNPQMVKLDKPYRHKRRSVISSNFGNNAKDYDENGYDTYTHSYPKSIIRFAKEKGGRDRLHPTQKPVKLMEYLIRTYTNSEDKILDPFMGSGTTLVAAKSLGRECIGIEINPDYVKIAEQRLKQEVLL